MEFGLIWIGIGIALAGYFIGNGLKNFKNPNAKGIGDIFEDDDDHELIKESDVHYFIGISKEDANELIEDHPDIPHIRIKNKVYYPKVKLRNWLKDLGA